MNRWLRSVRPKTDADADAWSASPAAQEILAGVHQRIAPETDPRTTGRFAGRVQPSLQWARRRRIWVPAAVLTAAAVVAATVLVGGGSSGPTGPHAVTPLAAGGPPDLPVIRPAAMLLSRYSSCPNLLEGLRSHTAATVTAYGLPGNPGLTSRDSGSALAAGKAAVPTSSTPNGSNTSSTNVQEPGVDEPDVVKTDGDRLVTVTDGALRVLDTAGRRVVGTLDLSLYAGAANAQLLVSGDHALVILNSGPAYSSWSARSDFAALSTYLFVDLSGRPKVTGSLRASGDYVDARLVGSTIRLVVQSAPVINFPRYNGTAVPSPAANQALVRRAPLSAWLPQYSITNGADTAKYTVPCEQISHPVAYTGTSMLTVYTLDINDLAGTRPAPVSVAADGDTVYATATSLYIAANPNWYCCVGTVVQKTEIHRFDIAGSRAPTYLGSGSIPGRLLSQYSLSEDSGYLRIATTALNVKTNSESSSVYVLNAATLKVTGQVGGLGQGEQIYSVRFVGPLAYVVTFRQTDPLYVVDLHNPTAPRVVGRLALTGYSDYLHDVGGGRLIGVGQEASPAGRVAGLQVSLFDVSTPALPTRTGQVVRSDAPGEGSFDPHSFLYWPATGLVAVPVQSWTPTQSGKVLVLRISGATLTMVGLVANPASTSIDDGLGIQRSLVVGDSLWTVSGGGVQVSNPSTLTRQAWIAFT